MKLKHAKAVRRDGAAAGRVMLDGQRVFGGFVDLWSIGTPMVAATPYTNMVHFQGRYHQMSFGLTAQHRAYDPVADTWTTLTASGIGLAGYEKHSVADETHIYQMSYTNIRRFNPGTGTWTTLAEHNDTQAAARAVWTLGNFVYVLRDANAGFTKFYRYSKSGNSWTTMPDGPANLIASGAAVVGDLAYVVGMGSLPTYAYDAAAGTWATLTKQLTPVSFAGVHRFGSDVFVCGGAQAGAATKIVQRFRPATGVWDHTAPMPFVAAANTQHQCLAGNDKELRYFGGSNADGLNATDRVQVLR